MFERLNSRENDSSTNHRYQQFKLGIMKRISSTKTATNFEEIKSFQQNVRRQTQLIKILNVYESFKAIPFFMRDFNLQKLLEIRFVN